MPRPGIRLLLDENLSPKVARALHELGYRVEAVQDAAGLGKQASDEQVLAVARQRSQVIVTVNLDMVLICIEAEEPVIWVDPKRKKGLTYPEMVLRFFEGIESWDRLIKAGHVLHALKTKDELLTFEEAHRRVLARIAKQRAAARKRQAKRQKPGQTELLG